MTKLKDDLDYDAVAINQLHTAIYLFQESVNVVLRLHSIKPHWMFALDNLFRNAVQAAITVLLPELGRNLAGEIGGVADGVDGRESTSEMGTVNSIKSHKTHDSFNASKFHIECREQIGVLKAENMRLLQELLESQKNYQTLLKQALDEHKLHVQMMQQMCDQLSMVTSATGSQRSQSQGYGSQLVPQISVTNSSVDTRLSEWLQKLGLDGQSVDRFVMEEYTMDDVLNCMTRDELRRLHLRGGIEMKVWRAIVEHREDVHCSNSSGSLPANRTIPNCDTNGDVSEAIKL